MVIGVPKETFPGERRVALVPAAAAGLVKKGMEVRIETGAGVQAGLSDEDYARGGAQAASRADVFAGDVVLQVRGLGANPQEGRADLALMREGQVIIGLADPLSTPQAVSELARWRVTAFSLELLPRITRAQSMDVLSSQATIAGYRAVILAAEMLPRMFPMLMTAAGTVAPARVLVLGAGVAGLQAIATARRLGAVVSAYDVRAAVKEQIQSLGAKFVELEITGQAEGSGGYARKMDEAFYERQRELLARVAAAHDVVICTAAIPGQRAPLLVTEEAVRGMPSGSVIIDLAAERGGNCALTRPDEVVTAHGVKVFGPTNLPAGIPYHASQMYARNITNFLLHLLDKDGQIRIDETDEITRETLLTRGGEVIHGRVQELLRA